MKRSAQARILWATFGAQCTYICTEQCSSPEEACARRGRLGSIRSSIDSCVSCMLMRIVDDGQLGRLEAGSEFLLDLIVHRLRFQPRHSSAAAPQLTCAGGHRNVPGAGGGLKSAADAAVSAREGRMPFSPALHRRHGE